MIVLIMIVAPVSEAVVNQVGVDKALEVLLGVVLLQIDQSDVLVVESLDLFYSRV